MINVGSVSIENRIRQLRNTDATQVGVQLQQQLQATGAVARYNKKQTRQ
jgi:hypothetical protein